LLFSKEILTLGIPKANQACRTEGYAVVFVQPENSFPIKSPKMLALYQEIADYAFHDRSCLFLGPTGAGKDFAARYYHQIWTKSGNGSGDFYAINCSVLTDTIAHSELFGHVKGAFTGAHRPKKGMFQVADKGVLFMDEIGDLPTAVQPMLLRALEPETGKAAPLGGIITFRTDTVRVLSATERPIKDLRPALVNRLGKLVTIPSLDERPEDRDASVEYFVLNALIKRRDIADLADKYCDIESPPKEWKTSRVKELANELACTLLQ
jgi:transcriptional regulator with AAA-type ATPase domain